MATPSRTTPPVTTSTTASRASTRPRPRPRSWKATWRTTSAFLLLLLTAVPAVAAPAGDDTAVEPDRITAWVRGRMDAHGMPGAAVAVVRGGQVVHLAGYGTADPDGRTVTPDTPFIIGSVSKPFTAAVVGQLVDEGLLAWDEPVWPHLSHLVDEPPAGFGDVTVEQLLTHTGGLGMSVGVAGAVQIHDGPDALDRRVAEVLAPPLASPPGKRFTYSNAGPMLLAATVEQVTGRSFAEELRDRVIDPLGMTGSFASGDDPRADDLASGHRQWFGRWRPADLPYDDAGVAMGYIGSTAADLAAFMQAHLDGHPAVPATATQIADRSVAPTGWDTPLDAGYGRGWFVDELAGERVVSHTGSLGHFTAHVLLVPGADDLGVAVLTNASAFVANSHEAQYDIGLGLTRLLLGEELQPAGPTPLMTLVVPVVVWAVVVLLLAAITRRLLRMRTRCRLPVRVTGLRRWVRSLLPGAAFLLVGGGLLLAPLSVVRHFYPDAGWGVTVGAWTAVAWGAVQLVLAVSALRDRSTSPRGANTPTRESTSDRVTAGA